MPDEHITATVDVSGWIKQKWGAILAHRSEAVLERPLPGILACLPDRQRESIISTEYFTRLGTGAGRAACENWLSDPGAGWSAGRAGKD
ncbi:hypothetical protein ACWCQZ_44795 [Streptomyces sp. NPDC002285]